MKIILTLIFCFLSAADVWAGEEEDLQSLPRGLGLPVMIRTAADFVEIKEINENQASFSATVDTRRRWRDKRLAHNDPKDSREYIEFLDEDADKKLSEMWHPQVAISNMVGEPAHQKLALRIFRDGSVELMERTVGIFSMDFSMEKFPFDHQKITVDLVYRTDPIERVAFDYKEEDIEFSNARQNQRVEGWKLGHVELEKIPQPGWHESWTAGLKISKNIQRDPKSVISTVFIPLFSTLLIPLFAIWLNKSENGEFTIEAFELTNIVVGGLFSVVALNFTVSSSYTKLVGDDNPVMQLFSLNYCILTVSFLTCILLFHVNIVTKILGPYIGQEFFAGMLWSVPSLTFLAAASIILNAYF